MRTTIGCAPGPLNDTQHIFQYVFGVKTPTASTIRASPIVIRCMLKKEDTRSRTLDDSSNSSDTDPYSGVTLNKKIVSSSQSLYSLATVGSQPLKLLCIYKEKSNSDTVQRFAAVQCSWFESCTASTVQDSLSKGH